MRWKLRRKHETNIGKTRVRRKFAWLPTVVSLDQTETIVSIWFEHYWVKEEYEQREEGCGDDYGCCTEWWEIARWVNGK